MAGKPKRKIFMTLVVILALVGTAFVSSYGATASQKRAEANAAGEKAASLYKQVGEAETKINKLESSIASKQSEIASTKTKLAAKEKEVTDQTDSLNARLTAMYKTGTFGFVDVILSSNDVSELITNISMVQKVLKNDKDILKSLQDDYKEIDTLKSQQEEQEKALTEDKAEIESTKASLKKQADTYKAEEAKKNAEADSLAAEAARQQAAAEDALNSGGGSSSSGYVWPCSGTITSYFGYRESPGGIGSTYHQGVDIGASTGTPVRSIANGSVTLASYYGGYGNCIMIYVGNGYTTLFGHLSRIAVSSGQYVRKGQVVGYVGSTGNSTGPHLHFGVSSGGRFINPYALY